MIRTIAVSAALVVTSAPLAIVSAATVNNTSLAQLNGPYGQGNATTMTNASGTVTTVTGPGGSANRANAPYTTGNWQQENVGGNASVGITTTYARSGTGSVSFSGVDGNSKADLEYYFAAPVSLTSVSTMSYDWYRNSSSTTNSNQVASLRLLVTNGAQFSNLIFEPVYNGVPVAPTDAWQTSQITTASTFWSSGNVLTGSAACPSCFRSLADWQRDNANWFVYGLSTGIGSGWSGSFSGAVDNISYNFGAAGSNSFNFEVAAATGPVPEPASWAMMLVGFGLLGTALRRRVRSGNALA